MPVIVAKRCRSTWSPAPRILQRRCACGGAAGPGGECAACHAKRLHQEHGLAPPIVGEVLRQRGEPLGDSTRRLMEGRFGYDFSRVRIHADWRAGESARAVNAAAYATGDQIAFDHGRYAPGSAEGTELLAHELAHVVQQRDAARSGPIAVAPVGDAAEHAADAAAATGGLPAAVSPGGRVVHRRLVVGGGTIPGAGGARGTPFRTAVQGLMASTCPDGGFTIDPQTGVVSSEPAFCEWHPPLVQGRTEADMSSTPVGCRCLCDVVNGARTTTVAFAPGGAPATQFRPDTGIGGVPSDPTVRVDPRFQGQYLINGRWVDIPFHLIFAHEICGHALPLMTGTQVRPAPGPRGGTPPHERQSVDVERQIAAEQVPALPRRPEDYSGGARQRP